MIAAPHPSRTRRCVPLTLVSHDLSRDCVGLTGWLEPTWNNTVLSVASGESFAYHGSRLGCVSHGFFREFRESEVPRVMSVWVGVLIATVNVGTRGKVLSRMFFFFFFLFSRGRGKGERDYHLEIIETTWWWRVLDKNLKSVWREVKFMEIYKYF